jgi:hypothetical protein
MEQDPTGREVPMSNTLWLARTAACAAVTALLTVLGFAPSALAGKGGTVRYEYEPTSLDYEAIGFLDGSRLGGASCNPNVDALWSGQVETKSLPGSVQGDGSFTITHKGETGKIVADVPAFSFIKASHSLVTACDAAMPPSASAYKNTECNPNSINSDLRIVGKVTGGVGTRVEVKWRLSLNPLGIGNELLPNSFSCVEPFAFPVADCLRLKTTINKLTAKKPTLPFGCLGTTSSPPPGSGYKTYGSSAAASGTLALRRTKIH